jgi:MFS family permease
MILFRKMNMILKFLLYSLGMTLTEIGIQFAIAPVATLIGTPLLGVLADKIGDFKRMLGISLVVCALLAYSLLFIPPIKTTSECETQSVSSKLSCPSNHTLPINVVMDLPICMEKSKERKKFKSKTFNTNPSIINLNDCTIECNSNDSFCFNNTDEQICISNQTFSINLNTISSQTQSINTSFVNLIFNSITYEKLICATKNVCDIRCPLKTSRIGNYSHKKIVDQKSRRLTFWLYMWIRISLFLVIVSEVSLLRAAILTIVGKCKSEYGYQRFWASIAMIVVPSITGVLMDYQGRHNRDSFAICFQIYAGFKILMAIISQFMNLNIKAPSLQIWKKVGMLFRNSEVTVLLLFVAFIGSAWGFIETFIVWYLEELGASRSIIGLSISLGAASGIPMSIFAGDLERKFGYIRILIFGIIVYAIRLIGYSYSANAYHVLIFETMEGITMTLVIITITNYSTILSTSELVATMQATWAALHFSVGRALGSGIGGLLMDNFGSKIAYQIYSGFCLIAALIYSIIYLFWLKKVEINRQNSLENEDKQQKLPKHELSVQNEDNLRKEGSENPAFIKNE